MMKGFSLLEFIVAITVFIAAVLSAYQVLDCQYSLTRLVLERTRPEQEANYRLLVLDGLLRNCSEKLEQDAFFAAVPFFYSDLQFGAESRPDAFSVVRLLEEKVPFTSTGSAVQIPASASFQVGTTLLLAGLSEAMEWEWTYAKIVKIVTQSDHHLLQLQYLLSKPPLVKGYLLHAEIHGFLYKNQTLYWISPAGQTAPFWDGLEEFSYKWNFPRLKLSWKSAETYGSFTSSL